MNTDFEEMLRDSMDSFTASARVPADLAGRLVRRRRRRQVASRVSVATAAAALATAAGVTVASVVSPAPPPGRPTATQTTQTTQPGQGHHGQAGYVGRAGNAAQLVVYATRAAAAAPAFNPAPGQWIYTDVLQANSSAGGGGFLFGPPDERQSVVSWMRADRLQYAWLEHGKVVVDPVLGSQSYYTPAQREEYQKLLRLGGLGGWPSSSYPYLDALPTAPARLKAIIAANVKSQSMLVGTGNTAIFNAIYNLMTSVVLSPRLSAGLYGVLAALPGVHFDAATDLAGRPGLGLYMVQNGYDKQEIVINPKTYAYLGYEDVAVKAQALSGTDGTRHVRQGQVLGWQALVASGVVGRPGQTP
jgi:hypothetical protein